MNTKWITRICAAATTAAVVGGTSPAFAQTSQSGSSSHSHQATTQPHGTADPSAQPSIDDVLGQLAQLRAQVARLEAALAAGHGASGTSGARGMGSMGSRGGMPGGAAMSDMPRGQGGGMGMDQGMMKGMSGSSATPGGGMGMMGMDMMGGGKSMMDQMMMMGMSRMGGGMQGGSMTSALPGFPGASHIYHVGATGFFLDHPEHITLTTDQQQRLGQIKETALLEQASLQRKIEQAEQELWQLTGADAPDAAKLEAKLREIEKLRGDQRLAFIRAVGNAATVLTDDQRKQLTGMLPPVAEGPTSEGGGMPGMGGG